MSSPRPNLFLIGSMKSGTTYLSELLGDHPDIFVSSPKELCYFVDGRVLRRMWPYMWKRGFWRSQDRYLSLFADAGAAPVVAEASTVYSQLPIFTDVPQRILALSPAARFIYIMRDPVERSISHYWHSVRWWGERRPILTAIRNVPQYQDLSYYAWQLQEYLRHIERERIYVLTYEDLLANPAEQLSRIYAWLKVDPLFRSARLGAAANERPDVVYQVRGLGLLEKFRRGSVYGGIAPHVPRAARVLGYRLALRAIRPAEVPVAEVQDYLRARQQRQTQELSALLNRSFPEWTTLHNIDRSPTERPLSADDSPQAMRRVI